MAGSWTVGRMLEWMHGYFEGKEVGSPLISARWLLSEITGLTFMELYTRFDRPLDQQELDALRGFVKRRAAGEPLQYITGSTQFCTIDVICRPGVLIPRPETEQLVQLVLERLQSAGSRDGIVRIADVGTGSGCIACAIASALPNSHVIAGDISKDALELASKNIEALGLSDRVMLCESDIGSGFPETSAGSFDVVVSNPPYIPVKVMEELPDEVARFEPRAALEGGDDGLDVFRRLARWAVGALRPGGMLAVELHETTLAHAADVSESLGLSQVETLSDLAGRPRFLRAIKAE